MKRTHQNISQDVVGKCCECQTVSCGHYVCGMSAGVGIGTGTGTGAGVSSEELASKKTMEDFIRVLYLDYVRDTVREVNVVAFLDFYLTHIYFPSNPCIMEKVYNYYSECRCCDRHQLNRDKFHISQFCDSVKDKPYTPPSCHCRCRQRMRIIKKIKENATTDIDYYSPPYTKVPLKSRGICEGCGIFNVKYACIGIGGEVEYTNQRRCSNCWTNYLYSLFQARGHMPHPIFHEHAYWI